MVVVAEAAAGRSAIVIRGENKVSSSMVELLAFNQKVASSSLAAPIKRGMA